MNSQQASQLANSLLIVVVFIIFIIFGLVMYWLFIKFRNKNSEANYNGKQTSNNNSSNANKKSIFKFMEFDDITDYMIIQKNHTRFLMVIECQGINYDLMSEMEKTGVEEGFVQFLNSLRHKIQIYIQTRPINLESSLEVYRQRVEDVEKKLNHMQIQYENMVESEQYSEEQIRKLYFEINRQKNLYEYGESVLRDTERMSSNRSILNKKYYIIIPYFSIEAGNDKLDKEELKGIAFSELYTRAQSIIRSISVCDVRGKVLNSNELVDLLYTAYNRDEAEVFSLDKALRAGFNEMYSTAPDVLEKKMKALDKEIEEKALKKAQQKINEAKTELESRIHEKQENLNDIIQEIARLIVEENEQYIGQEVKELAIEKINQEITKEGGKVNEKKKANRSRSKKTTV